MSHNFPKFAFKSLFQLSEVGSDGFVEAEGQALKTFTKDNAIISLTGSNPMHEEGMASIAQKGKQEKHFFLASVFSCTMFMFICVLFFVCVIGCQVRHSLIKQLTAE